jgi:crotonobetaine/carnitine-CoA ligase
VTARDVGVLPATVLPATVPELLTFQAARQPDADFALLDGGRRVSWGEMLERAGRCAAGLAALGVGPGDTVVIALGNRLEFLETWFALALLGAVEVPINPELVGARLLYVLNHARARVAVVEPTPAERIARLSGELVTLEHIVVPDWAAAARPGVTTSSFAELSAGSTAYRRHPAKASDLSAVLYTSGSSGPPKGVMVPYGQHLANARQACAAASITGSDVLYLCLPLHHNMAQGYGILPALLAGCAVRLAPRFERARFWSDVIDCGATVWPFVGGLLSLLAQAPARPDDAANPLRVAYGVPVPEALHRPFENRFALRLVHGYGSTEATIPVWSTGECPPGAAGQVLPDYEVRVLDHGDREVAAGVTGEICVRPRVPYTIFSGYFRDAERTVSAWRNLWFHTGDRGLLDDSGRLWFRGRAGDVIRRFGEFIDAEEIEAAAATHEGVADVACVGVDDTVSGQEVLVVATPRAGASLDPAELRGWLAQRLPPYATPRYVRMDDEIPRTPTGKIERYKIRAAGLTPGTFDARDNERQTL